MRKSTQFLNDEHMQLYEWSGTGAGITLSPPEKSKRTHPWHASYAVLAVLTSLLILNGCNKGAAEKADPQIGEAAREMKGEEEAPLKDAATTVPEAAQGLAPAPPGNKTGHSEGMQKQ